jgi:hypothetical protein
MKAALWIVPAVAAVAVVAVVGLSRVPLEQIGTPPAPVDTKTALPRENDKPRTPPQPTKEALDSIALADVYLPKIQTNLINARDGMADGYDCGEIASALKNYNRALVFLNAAERVHDAKNTIPEAYKRWEGIREDIGTGLIWCTEKFG